MNGIDAYVAGVRVFAAGLLFGGEKDAEEFAGATLDELTGVMLRHKNLWAPMVADAGTSDAYKTCALSPVFGDVCAVETGLFRKLDWLAAQVQGVEGTPSEITAAVWAVGRQLGWGDRTVNLYDWRNIADPYDWTNTANPVYAGHAWGDREYGKFDGVDFERVLLECEFEHHAMLGVRCCRIGPGRYLATAAHGTDLYRGTEAETHERLAEALAA